MEKLVGEEGLTFFSHIYFQGDLELIGDGAILFQKGARMY
jgi:hypothetical protein